MSLNTRIEKIEKHFKPEDDRNYLLVVSNTDEAGWYEILEDGKKIKLDYIPVKQWDGKVINENAIGVIRFEE